MIALQAAAGNECVAAFRQGMGDDELELADLVATEQAAAEVVALDPEPVALPPALAGTGQVLQGGGPAGQFDPRWELRRGHQPMDLRVPFGSTAWT